MTPTERLVDLTKENQSFSKQVPGLQIAWDSTSMGLLKECPYKYYLSMIEGWQPKSQSIHLTFGLYLHSALEEYDHLRAEGQSYDEALHGTLRWMLANTGERKQVYYCFTCDKSSTEEESCPHCLAQDQQLIEGETVFIPWQSSDPNKNRANLIRTVIWYIENFKDDYAKTVILRNGKPAVELSFRMELPLISPEGNPYLACGHMDRVVEYNDNEYILDRKTTKTTISTNYFDQYSPDNQMSLYVAAGQVVLQRPVKGVIIDGCQVAVNFSRFQRGFANRTKGQIEEYLHTFQQYIRLAEHYAEMQDWPMNDKSCHHYGGCQFRGICSKDPSVRLAFLQTDFARRIWDPLEVRGE